MQSQEPLTVTLEPDPLQCRAEESITRILRALAVRLHSSGLHSVRQLPPLKRLCVFRSHQAVFQWIHRVGKKTPDPPTFTRALLSWANQNASVLVTTTPSRVAIDEIAVTIGTNQHWLYAVIDVETKFLLDV